MSFFLLISWAKGLSILLIFSENQLLDSLILCVIFFVSISLICSDFYYFLLLTGFGSGLFLFLQILCCIVRSFICALSIFFNVDT